MKLNKITIQNFLGAQALGVDLATPISLFCGANGAGKSSIQEAVRMALTGESVRVGLKKDYAKLVTEGAASGFAEVATDDGVCSIVLPSGKGSHITDCAALPFVLDAGLFAASSPDEKRKFLFELMGVKTDGPAVKERLIQKGCNAKMVDTIAIMMRAGFDAAHKEAQSKARDEKAVWRNITGETYGEKKAETWAAETPVFDASKLAGLEDELAKVDAEMAAINQDLGALLAAQRQHAESAGKIEDLREKASKYARIQDKLLKDETELQTWQAKVDEAKQAASGGRKVGLVHEMAVLLDALNSIMDDSEGVTGHHLSGNVLPWGEVDEFLQVPNVLNDYKEAHGEIVKTGTANPETASKLPEYEKALRLMQSAVANGKRDLTEADTAARAIAEVEATIGTAEDKSQAIEGLKLQINAKMGLKTKLAGDINDLLRQKTQAAQAQQKTDNAKAAHEAVQAWGKIADALAPDGIQSEMLGEALGPLSNRLKDTAEMTLWATVAIDQDMGISYAGRPYALLSESEQWRVDAMIAEAIAYISKIGVIALDRFDVLDSQGREDLMVWMHMLAEGNEINTALLFGTLKTAPTALPPSIQVLWVEKQAEEVAA